MSGPIDKAFPPGTSFGAYRIVRSLGEGASGAVYEVVKSSVGKRMALKVLHRSLSASDDDLMRFEREARIGGAIEHPNVVQVFDVGEHDGHRFMTMELLEGETLQQRLEREGVLPIRDVADLFVPIMSALGAVHDQGLVHRDLKPGNIFLVARRQGVVEPKLLDFGVSKDLSGIVGGDMTRAHSMVGSPSYMSPEQAEQASDIGVSSDQFTIGAIMWECLIGRKLFDGENVYQVLFKIAGERIARPSELRADVPPELDALIMRALERDPARRFASIRDIGVGLLANCSEHVRTLWADELLGSADGSEDTEARASVGASEETATRERFDPVASFDGEASFDAGAGFDPEESFDDEKTSLRPSLSVGAFAPAPVPAAPQWPREAQAPVVALAPFVAPARPLLLSLPPGAEVPGRFPGDETFRPAARAAESPARRGRAAWIATLAVIGVVAVAVTALIGVRHESAHAPSAEAVTALVPAAAPRPAPAPPVAEHATPVAADAGAAVARPVAPTVPAAPVEAAPPAADARHRHGDPNKPRTHRTPRIDMFGQ